MIIEKDISWLYERVPDFDLVVSTFPSVFEGGGYLAGGALRAFILNGGVAKSFKATERRYQSFGPGNEPVGFGDIDFFFYTQAHCKKAFDEHYKRYMSKYSPPSSPNSYAKFAYEVSSRSINNIHMKHQYIYSNYGKPWNIVEGFDIANCKIATDGKKVWMAEDWEDNEKNKFLKIDNFKAKFLVSRVNKYLSRYREYTVHPDNRHDLLVTMLKAPEGLRGFVKKLLHFPIFDPKYILMFYEKLGYCTKKVSEQDYSQGIRRLEDYAVHLYNKRVGIDNEYELSAA